MICRRHFIFLFCMFGNCECHIYKRGTEEGMFLRADETLMAGVGDVGDVRHSWLV